MTDKPFQKTYARIGQKAVVIRRDGKILILKRAGSDSDAKWSLPGGALEKDEDPTDGIIREIKEETGLEVSSVIPFSLRSYRNKEDDFVVIIGYKCNSGSEEVVLNEEHTDSKWLSSQEILDLDLSSDGRYFVEKFSSIPNQNT